MGLDSRNNRLEQRKKVRAKIRMEGWEWRRSEQL